MPILPTQLNVSLPDWVNEFVDLNAVYVSDADKVALAIALSAQNVQQHSGGPFGAVVFGADHRVIAVGVNRVVPQNNSLAHAETMAYMLAQQRLQQFRLNALSSPITLATSSQPCCQCFGATVWAGVDRLLIGARAEDVMRLTSFDEGPLPVNWQAELQQRGIEVVADIGREQACEVLQRYQQQSGISY